MTATKPILITGAAGTIGRILVSDLASHGVPVTALLRPGGTPPPAEWQGLPVDVHEVDLSDDTSARDLVPLLERASAVIHAAGTFAADDAGQHAGTVSPFAHLLIALSSVTGGPRLVLISSMSVLRGAGFSGQVIDEGTPSEPHPENRDAYTRARLAVEAMARAANLDDLVILRPGFLATAPGAMNPHIGLRLGPLVVAFGRRGDVPLVDPTRLAHAVRAAVFGQHPPPVMHVLNAALPNRAQMIAAIGRSDGVRAILVLPYSGLDLLARTLQPLSRIGLRLPGLLRLATLRARLRPAHYVSIVRPCPLSDWEGSHAN